MSAVGSHSRDSTNVPTHRRPAAEEEEVEAEWQRIFELAIRKVLFLLPFCFGSFLVGQVLGAVYRGYAPPGYTPLIHSPIF